MWTRSELKTNAKAVLGRNYWKAVLTALILTLLTGASAGASFSDGLDGVKEALQGVDFNIIMLVMSLMAAGTLFNLLIGIFLKNPISIGCYRFFVRCRGGQADLGDITVAFGSSENYMNVVKITFLQNLFIGLWSLLLVIPGIIKSYEYAMIPYLLAEYPEMSKDEAFETSKRMMDGNKMNAFVLELSFIGWYLLAGFTCGVLGIFYVGPYNQLTMAELYHRLKEEGRYNGRERIQ